jgi:hypothetical protein
MVPTLGFVNGVLLPGRPRVVVFIEVFLLFSGWGGVFIEVLVLFPS